MLAFEPAESVLDETNAWTRTVTSFLSEHKFAIAWRCYCHVTVLDQKIVVCQRRMLPDCRDSFVL